MAKKSVLLWKCFDKSQKKIWILTNSFHMMPEDKQSVYGMINNTEISNSELISKT